MTDTTNVDLAKMFKAATKTLAANQASLNQADQYNHNHGDNMVEIFQTISKAVTAKKAAPASEQLEYASQLVAQKSSSGSAKAYSAGLERAAQQFQGRSINPQSAVELISALMGAGTPQQQPASPAAGLLGGLLGGSDQGQGGGAGDLLGSLLGGGSSQPQGNAAGDLLGSLLGGSTPSGGSSSGSGDMLGSLIGGLMGGQTQQQSSSGLDTGDLINIGMQLFQAYQGSSGKPSSQGGGVAGQLLETLLSGSSMGSSSHRKESGMLVADALLKIAMKYLAGRKSS